MASTRIYRPGYVNDFTGNLISQINNAKDSQYANLDYAGLNSDQQQALQTMMSGSNFNSYVDQLMGAGQTGLDTLNSAYSRISELYQNGTPTAQEIENLTNQLYNPTQVEEGIKAANQISERKFSTQTNPEIAQQMNAFGAGNVSSSANRLAHRMAEESLVNEETQNASNIANTAYNNAQQQATQILSANAANNKSALAGLINNAGALAGGYNTAAQMSQNAMSQSVAASQQQLQDQQNALNTRYANQIGQQNQQLSNIQNRLGLTSAMNGVLGQNKSVSVSGGGGGVLGGMAAGAMAGSAGGPWGMLAGAALGAAAST
ncbi:hypothetical protein [Enterobacter pseudoroggenkampii]|uniref:hypothetical protein n=1 Tax=Enterobacter pseudoroggenkampii TaxID=2996112 RepID=UPI002264D6D6|nr:hypothetical protein [Enterobacter pseudoroggenkampii]MCX8289115.1 hypothetical protein [Enterobacter pseudoroggenkampii]